jgi:mRNA-degrading endonuclease toxin of MazEF toxin-antitoxin module
MSPETIVVAIRDPHGGRIFPILVEVDAGIGGLAKRSVVDCGHIHTIPKAALGRRLGELSGNAMARVDQALRVSLALEK